MIRPPSTGYGSMPPMEEVMLVYRNALSRVQNFNSSLAFYCQSHETCQRELADILRIDASQQGILSNGRPLGPLTSPRAAVIPSSSPFSSTPIAPPLSDLMIGFYGSTGSGKTTMINTLLGSAILPTGHGASTGRICIIRFAPLTQARIRLTSCEEIISEQNSGTIYEYIRPSSHSMYTAKPGPPQSSNMSGISSPPIVPTLSPSSMLQPHQKLYDNKTVFPFNNKDPLPKQLDPFVNRRFAPDEQSDPIGFKKWCEIVVEIAYPFPFLTCGVSLIDLPGITKGDSLALQKVLLHFLTVVRPHGIALVYENPYFGDEEVEAWQQLASTLDYRSKVVRSAPHNDHSSGSSAGKDASHRKKSMSQFVSALGTTGGVSQSSHDDSIMFISSKTDIESVIQEALKGSYDWNSIFGSGTNVVLQRLVHETLETKLESLRSRLKLCAMHIQPLLANSYPSSPAFACCNAGDMNMISQDDMKYSTALFIFRGFVAKLGDWMLRLQMARYHSSFASIMDSSLSFYNTIIKLQSTVSAISSSNLNPRKTITNANASKNQSSTSTATGGPPNPNLITSASIVKSSSSSNIPSLTSSTSGMQTSPINIDAPTSPSKLKASNSNIQLNLLGTSPSSPPNISPTQASLMNNLNNQQARWETAPDSTASNAITSGVEGAVKVVGHWQIALEETTGSEGERIVNHINSIFQSSALKEKCLQIATNPEFLDEYEEKKLMTIMNTPSSQESFGTYAFLIQNVGNKRNKNGNISSNNSNGNSNNNSNNSGNISSNNVPSARDSASGSLDSSSGSPPNQNNVLFSPSSPVPPSSSPSSLNSSGSSSISDMNGAKRHEVYTFLKRLMFMIFDEHLFPQSGSQAFWTTYKLSCHIQLCKAYSTHAEQLSTLASSVLNETLQQFLVLDDLKSLKRNSAAADKFDGSFHRLLTDTGIFGGIVRTQNYIRYKLMTICSEVTSNSKSPNSKRLVEATISMLNKAQNTTLIQARRIQSALHSQFAHFIQDLYNAIAQKQQYIKYMGSKLDTLNSSNLRFDYGILLASCWQSILMLRQPTRDCFVDPFHIMGTSMTGKMCSGYVAAPMYGSERVASVVKICPSPKNSAILVELYCYYSIWKRNPLAPIVFPEYIEVAQLGPPQQQNQHPGHPNSLPNFAQMLQSNPMAASSLASSEVRVFYLKCEMSLAQFLAAYTSGLTEAEILHLILPVALALLEYHQLGLYQLHVSTDHVMLINVSNHPITLFIVRLADFSTSVPVFLEQQQQQQLISALHQPNQHQFSTNLPNTSSNNLNSLMNQTNNSGNQHRLRSSTLFLSSAQFAAKTTKRNFDNPMMNQWTSSASMNKQANAQSQQPQSGLSSSSNIPNASSTGNELNKSGEVRPRPRTGILFPPPAPSTKTAAPPPNPALANASTAQNSIISNNSTNLTTATSQSAKEKMVDQSGPGPTIVKSASTTSASTTTSSSNNSNIPVNTSTAAPAITASTNQAVKGTWRYSAPRNLRNSIEPSTSSESQYNCTNTNNSSSGGINIPVAAPICVSTSPTVSPPNFSAALPPVDDGIPSGDTWETIFRYSGFSNDRSSSFGDLNCFEFQDDLHALGSLMAQLIRHSNMSMDPKKQVPSWVLKWITLIGQCCSPNTSSRTSISQVISTLNSFKKKPAATE